MEMIQVAVDSGARKTIACETVGLCLRTVQRWEHSQVDCRQTAIRPEPANKLSPEERQAILEVCNTAEYQDLPPSQIVPKLADKEIYLASESSFYRILRANNQLKHRGKAKPKTPKNKPKSHTATAPNQIWSWDITYCPSRVIGRFFYLYMIIDIFSRKIVGWEVHEQESGEHAATLLQRTVWAEKCLHQDVVLHSDNGSPMKSLTMLAKMQELGVIASRSRPSVSNDNPYSESLFRTCKYARNWPSEGFKNLEEVRAWCQQFTHWYNSEHCHSRINYVTPEQRHLGIDEAILKQRDQLYQAHRQKHPLRWSKNTRNWEKPKEVTLNPDKENQAA